MSRVFRETAVSGSSTPGGGYGMFCQIEFLFLAAILPLTVMAFSLRRAHVSCIRADDGLRLQSGMRGAGSDLPASRDRASGAELSDEALANEKLLAEIWEREKAQEELKSTAARFKALFELAPDAVFLKSEDGNILDANLAAEKTFGYDRRALCGKNIRSVIPGKWRSNGHSGPAEAEARNSDGNTFLVEVCSRPISLDDGPAVLVVARDVTQRKKSEQELRTLTMALEQSPATVVITDTRGRIVYVNSRFTETTGYAKDEAMGMDMRMLLADEQSESLYGKVWETVTSGRQWRGEICTITREGRKIWELASISPVTNDAGEQLHYVIVKDDITESKRRERKIKRIALYDSLTGLPNRALLMDRLDLALAQTERSGSHTAILYLDLDGFKSVNDGFGHEAGDKVLTEAGRRIASSIRKSDTAARIGGDEFVVILRSVNRLEDVDASAERIIESINKPFDISGRTFLLGTSIGVSLAPDHSMDRDELIRMADQAMYRVKQAGKNDYRYYDPLPGDSASA